MKTRNAPTEERRVKWWWGERGMFWTIGTLVVFAIAWSAWNDLVNDPPVVHIPTPAMPSPNAYDYYMKASKQITGNPINSATARPTPAQMKAALPKNLPALKTFREGMNYPFLNPPIRSLEDERKKDFAGFRDLARLLVLEGRVSELRGDMGHAAQSYADCLKLGHDVPRGGPMIHSLVGIACESIGRRPFWSLTEKLNATDARATAKRLEALHRTRLSFSETMQEEKWACQASLLEAIQDKADNLLSRLYKMAGVSPSPMEVWTGNILISMLSKGRIFRKFSAYMDTYISHTREPYIPNAPLPKVPDDPLSEMLVPLYKKGQIKDWDNQMQTALLTATLALRAYQQEKRDYPSSLDSLVSGGYLTKVPGDPFAGTGPLRYKRVSGQKYLLYSVGPDGKDDGGKPIDAKKDDGTPKRWVEAGMVGDFVARVNTY